jgi:hypothetical protein
LPRCLLPGSLPGFSGVPLSVRASSQAATEMPLNPCNQ